MQKEKIDANTLYKKAFRLAKMVYDSGFRPDYVLMLMRGGAPIGIIMHEYFRSKGIELKHEEVKAVSYSMIGKQHQVAFQGLEVLQVTKNKKILIVDDIFDTGKTIQSLLYFLGHKKDVKIATLYYKEKCNTTHIVPDFYIEKTNKWIVFPHELV
jgi:uncharacterized protein